MAVTRTYDMPRQIREDLADIIYNISPTRTPFMTNIGRSDADSTFTEWQVEALASVDTSNAAIEGADATDTAFAAPGRVGNYTQISTKTVNVSGTSFAVDTAGFKTLEAKELAKKSKELKRDMESILLLNQAAVVGSGVAARKLAGFPAWLKTNVVVNGLTPPTLSASPDGYPNAAWTGAAAAVDPTEAMLKAAIALLYGSGGETKMLMVGPVNKQKFSAFTGIATNRVQLDDPRPSFIVGAADVYVSDFGNITMVPNLFQPEGFAFLVDPDYVSVSYLRNFDRIPLARTGDSKRTEIVVEYTLKVDTEKAHGCVANLKLT